MDTNSTRPRGNNDGRNPFRNDFENDLHPHPHVEIPMANPENDTYPLGEIPHFQGPPSLSSASLTPTTYTDHAATDPFDEDEEKPLTGHGMSRYPPITYVRPLRMYASFVTLVDLLYIRCCRVFLSVLLILVHSATQTYLDLRLPYLALQARLNVHGDTDRLSSVALPREWPL